MVYDPAWDMPQVNWVQQGAYEQGSVPPIVEPDAGTQVFLGPVAREWLPWICGALDVLRNPSNWIVADDTAMYNTLRRVDTLLGLICGNGGSVGGEMVRFQNCVLQTSTDGVTWTDVPGWTDNFANCIRSNIPPPVPVPPPGSTVPQRACNIAGFLADAILKESIDIAIGYVSTSGQAVNMAIQMVEPYLARWAWTGPVLTFIDDLYALVVSETVGNLTAARDNPAIWSELTCVIYNAIRAVGYVDASNYEAVYSAMSGLQTPAPPIISILQTYWHSLTLAGVQVAQNAAALETVDCSGCATTWCHHIDFTLGTAGWTIYSAGRGVYVPGAGWRQVDGGWGYGDLQITGLLPATSTLYGVIWEITSSQTSTGLTRETDVQDNPGVSNIRQDQLFAGDLSANGGAAGDTGYSAPGANAVVLAWRSPLPNDICTGVQILGTGTNPYGGAECTQRPYV